MSNELQHSTSPYLLQHADNPVDWLEWGEAAFAKAREENKPIFLSVGYSTCHWCHVMAHESFESEEIARQMNENFINVKVDREERPDVDQTYMTFIQATSGSGGWPMSVWLTPDLVPILGGTYFPPEDKGGRAGFPRVLDRVAEMWHDEPEVIAERGSDIIRQIQKHLDSESGDEPPSKASFGTALSQFSQRYDHHHGGFSDAPKFPRPAALHLLLRIGRNLPEDDQNRARDMALKTLAEMAQGGIHDHLGGGFHRYSVDGYWHVPHFEKMLYDQGQLATSYLEGWGLTQHRTFLDTALRIFEYAERDLARKGGGFYSAEDADSLVPEGEEKKINPFAKENAEAALAGEDLSSDEHHGSHGKEGAFYVWTKAQIEEALGADAEMFMTMFGVEAEGNARFEGDPNGEFRGENILFRAAPIAKIAKETNLPGGEIRKRIGAATRKLFALRNERPRPHCDEKIVTGWNALMVSALALAGRLTGDAAHLDSAQRTLDFLKQELWDGTALYRSWKDTRSEVEAFANDHAYLIDALIEMYQATGEIELIRWAVQLQEAMDTKWWDEEQGGYFSTRAGGDLLLSIKEEHDGAEPSANGMGARNLLRLGALLHREEFLKKGEQILCWSRTAIEESPLSCPYLVAALDLWLESPQTVVVTGEGDLLVDLRRRFEPRTLLIDLDAEGARAFFENESETFAAMKSLEGKATAYVCEGETCQAPVTSL